MKRLFVFLLVLAIFFSGAAAGITSEKIRLVINGKEENPDVSPVMVNGRVMVPIRFIAEKFSKEVKWDELKQTVYVSDPGIFTEADLSSMPADALKARKEALTAMKEYLETCKEELLWLESVKQEMTKYKTQSKEEWNQTIAKIYQEIEEHETQNLDELYRKAKTVIFVNNKLSNSPTKFLSLPGDSSDNEYHQLIAKHKYSLEDLIRRYAYQIQLPTGRGLNKAQKEEYDSFISSNWLVNDLVSTLEKVNNELNLLQ